MFLKWCVWNGKERENTHTTKKTAGEMSAITLLFRIENQIETTSQEFYRNNTEL